MMRSGFPATLYGGNALMYIGSEAVAGINDALVQFDLTSIPPDAKVVTATLRLYRQGYIGGNNCVMSIYRCLRVWNNAAFCWNNYEVATPWQAGGCQGALDRDATVLGVRTFTPGEANGYKDISLIPAVIEGMVAGSIPSRGFLCYAPGVNDNVATITSTDAGANMPQLVIAWEPALGRLPTYIVDGLQGGITLKATIEQFANETWVRHTPVGGALTRTPAAHSIDLASQAKFGRKDQPLSGGAASVTIADQISDTYLSFQSTPNMPDITLAPGTVIKDQNGNVVPPEEIRPNNWMLIENLALPTSAVWASLTANPSALFIEEVAYSEDSGLQITAGRDRFTQSLVARIAGRGGG